MSGAAETNAQRHTLAYSGARQYRLRNTRFQKEATVSVEVTYRPREGKRFTTLERFGSKRLIGVVEKLLASEADASKPENRKDHEIIDVIFEAVGAPQVATFIVSLAYLLEKNNGCSY